MELKSYFAQDQRGNAVAGATCYLYLRGTETLATGLEDADGSPLDNPFLSQSNGAMNFAAPNGFYSLKVVIDALNYTISLQCMDIAEAIDAAATATEQADRASSLADNAQASATSAASSAQSAINARDSSQAYATQAANSAQLTDEDRIAAAMSANAAATSATQASESAEAAANSLSAVQAAAGAAATSESNARASADAAAASESNAANSATLADSSRAAAVEARTGAETAQGAAQEAQEGAEAAEVRADAWANNPEDVPVTGDQYSAFHWAKKAEQSGGDLPGKLEALTSDVATITDLGARQLNFSSNCLIRYDILEINGSTTIRGAQDFAFDEMNRHMYLTEGGAITRYPMDGRVGVSPIDFSLPGGTAIGHQGLSVERIKNTSNIKLWTTSSAGGRFAARFDYAPGVTIDTAEVYELFPVNQFANSTSCTPAVSSCGQYLVAHGMIFGSPDASDTRVRVFRIKDLLDHGPGDCTGLALYEWSTLGILTNSSNPLQGIACDGQNVYLIAGGTGFSADVNKRLSIHTIRGALLASDTNITIGREQAALDGDGSRYEPEGLSLVTNSAGGVTLMAGILSGQPSQRRFRIYQCGIKKPQSAKSIKLVDSTGSFFYSTTMCTYHGTPEGALTGEPGSLVLSDSGKGYIKKSGYDSANWAEVLDMVSGTALINSFGLGVTGNANSSPDLDAWRTTATFVASIESSVAAGLPITTVGHVIRHVAGTAANGHTQTATPITSVAANKNRRWNRQMWAGTWTPWQEVAYVDSTLAVMQSFGLGNTVNQPNWPNTSLNNCSNVGSGMYRTIGSTTDYPAGWTTSNHVDFSIRQNDATQFQAVQIIYGQNGKTAIRTCTGTPGAAAPTWTAWVEFTYNDSPAFTGTPSAPTPAAATATTQIANCAFLQSEMARMGIGTSQSASLSDLNNGTTGGIYRYTNTALNPPVAGQSGTVLVAAYSSTLTTQLAMHAGQSTANPKLFYRVRLSSAWTNWTEIPVASDIAALSRAATLTGLSVSSTAQVSDTDSILVAIGKLQAQINAK